MLSPSGKPGKADPTAYRALEGPVLPCTRAGWQLAAAPVPERLCLSGTRTQGTHTSARPTGPPGPGGRPVGSQESAERCRLQTAPTNPTRPELARDSMHT